jgi:hypothetical protein
MDNSANLPGYPLAASPADPDLIAIGEKSTEFIPRLWAERMLGSIRADRPGVWKAELFKASTGG